MKRFQPHISLFLLLLFVFPQMNNTLHYFVVEHHFLTHNSIEKQFTQNHQNHDCQQSIFKIPSTLLFEFSYVELTKNLVFSKIKNHFFISFYSKILFKNPSDRGPPF